MSRQSANFAAFPVLTQDSQGPQEVAWGRSHQPVKIPVHKAADMQLFRSLEQASAPISALAFSADGRQIAAGLQDGSVAIWVVSSGVRTVFRTPDTSVSYVAFRPGGMEVLSASKLGSVHLWRRDGGTELPAREIPKGVTAAVLAVNGKIVATSHRDETVVIRDAASLSPRLTITRQIAPVSKLALNRQGDRLAAANLLGKVRIYELDPGRLRRAAVQIIGQARVSALNACRDSVPAAAQ